jgi:hypothetical protein
MINALEATPLILTGCMHLQRAKEYDQVECRLFCRGYIFYYVHFFLLYYIKVVLDIPNKYYCLVQILIYLLMTCVLF